MKGEKLYLILKEEHNLQLSENSVDRKISVHPRSLN
jgi:hypothetical protein